MRKSIFLLMTTALISENLNAKDFRHDLNDFIGTDGNHYRPVKSSDVKSFGMWKRANCKKSKFHGK